MQIVFIYLAEECQGKRINDKKSVKKDLLSLETRVFCIVDSSPELSEDLSSYKYQSKTGYQYIKNV